MLSQFEKEELQSRAQALSDAEKEEIVKYLPTMLLHKELGARLSHYESCINKMGSLILDSGDTNEDNNR